MNNVNDINRPAESAIWMMDFVAKNNRLPTSIEYKEAGFGTDFKQCSCSCNGQCVLEKHSLYTHSCDRNCYADQLRDVMNISDELRYHKIQMVRNNIGTVRKLYLLCDNLYRITHMLNGNKLNEIYAIFNDCDKLHETTITKLEGILADESPKS